MTSAELRIRRFQVQLLMGAPFAFKHLHDIKTPQTGFPPDKFLTNEVGFSSIPKERQGRFGAIA
jgi:hypothetical protein